MDEDEFMAKAYSIESNASDLFSGVYSDLCSLSTGQKLDVLYSLQNALEDLGNVYKKLKDEFFKEAEAFIGERYVTRT